MSVSIRAGKAASEAEIVALERALGRPICVSFRKFLATNDRAEPDPNIFRINDQNDSGVREFIPLAEILEERAFLNPLPKYAYPIASDDCGNYVVIDEERGGAVFFWDHEIEEGLTKLAANFDEFLAGLQPFDPASVQLKPEQVISSWIDPEFLKRIKGK